MKNSYLHTKQLFILFAMLFGIGLNAQNPYFILNNQFIHEEVADSIPNYNGFTYGDWSTYNGYDFAELGANMVGDKNGNPLFYVVDGNILDKDGKLIEKLGYRKLIRPQSGISTQINYSCFGQTLPRQSYHLIGGLFEFIGGYSEVCIVPDPINCKEFYVLTSAAPTNDGAFPDLPSGSPINPYAEPGVYSFKTGQFLPFYAKVDVSPMLDNDPPTLQHFPEVQATLVTLPPPCSNANPSGGYQQYGSDIIQNFNVKELFTQAPPSNSDVKIPKAIYWAATPTMGTGNNAYCFAFMFDGTNFHTFKIDRFGINVVPNSKFTIPIAPTGTRMRNELEVVKLSNGNFRLGFATEINDPAIPNKVVVGVCEYDAAGIVVPNSLVLKPFGGPVTNVEDFSNVHGLEFTPDGNTLLFTNETNAYISSSVNYISAPYSSSSIQAMSNVPANLDLKYSQIELTKDTLNNLYMIFGTEFNHMSLLVNSTNPSAWVWNPTWQQNTVSWNGPTDPYAWGLGTSNDVEGKYKMFLLPDQIDNLNYEAFQTQNIACCYFYSRFDIDRDFYFPTGTTVVGPAFPDTIIGRDSAGLPMVVVFNPTTKTRGDIHIPANANVTFNNLRLEFTPEYVPQDPSDSTDVYIAGVGLIVENSTNPSINGGRLTTNASTLTVCTECEGTRMWPGVEVWGENISFQGTFASSREGWYRMNAGSVIEHAVNGITIGDINGLKGGGVVEAVTATVKNCQRGLLMYPSANATANKTKFTNCTFTINQALRDNARYPFTLVRVDDGIGVQFKGCNFTNQHSAYNQGYYGIKSNNSKINVVANLGVRNKFENLSYGIFATASQQGRVINCHYSDFTRNKIGAMLGTVDYCSFTNNNFKMIDNRNDGTYFSVGLIMENSTGFTITNNDFRNNNPATGIASNPTIGIIIANSNVSQAIDNFIVKNTFTKLHFGIQNKERNFHDYVNTQAINNEGGLVMYCNSFTAPIAWADIANTGGFNPVSGIRHLQGYSQGANTAFTTNNTYSNTGLGTKDIYQDNTALFIETHWSNNVLRPEPLVVSSSVAKFYSATSLNTCSGDLLYQRVNNENVISEVNNLTNQFNDIKGDLAYGSSTQIIDMIKSNQSAGTIKNNLMSVVPYLSDEVLLAYLSTNPPSGHLQQVLSACAPLSPTFLEKFNSTKQPGGIKSIVNSLPTEGISPIVLAYNNLVKINSEIDWVYADAIKTNLNDLESETAHNTALGFIKAAYKNGDCKGKLCRFEISYKDEASALENLEILREVLLAGTPKLEIHEKLYDLYNKDIKKELETRPLLVSELETIATNTTDRESAILAIGLLNYIQDREIPMTFVGMTNGSSSKVMMQNLEEEYDNTSEISNESISNFPNPFTGKTTLTAKVPDYATSSEMVVINVLGKEIARYTLQAGENAITFDNEDAKGILYYSLYINGKRKATKMMLKQ